jgi:hypothetical protein
MLRRKRLKANVRTMRRSFLILVLRCVLAFGLAFTPVANALNMSRMAISQEDRLPCHEPAQQQAEAADASCCPSPSQCHCAMATCLPADVANVSSPSPLPDHPQTVRRLTLGLSSLPETPPPRPLP